MSATRGETPEMHTIGDGEEGRLRACRPRAVAHQRYGVNDSRRRTSLCSLLQTRCTRLARLNCRRANGATRNQTDKHAAGPEPTFWRWCVQLYANALAGASARRAFRNRRAFRKCRTASVTMHAARPKPEVASV